MVFNKKTNKENIYSGTSSYYSQYDKSQELIQSPIVSLTACNRFSRSCTWSWAMLKRLWYQRGSSEGSSDDGASSLSGCGSDAGSTGTTWSWTSTRSAIMLCGMGMRTTSSSGVSQVAIICEINQLIISKRMPSETNLFRLNRKWHLEALLEERAATCTLNNSGQY